MNFGFGVPFGDWKHYETGCKICNKECDQRQEWMAEYDGNGGSEHPVAVADPFTFGY